MDVRLLDEVLMQDPRQVMQHAWQNATRKLQREQPGDSQHYVCTILPGGLPISSYFYLSELTRFIHNLQQIGQVSKDYPVNLHRNAGVPGNGVETKKLPTTRRIITFTKRCQ